MTSHAGSEAVPYRPKRETADDKYSATHHRFILKIQYQDIEERSFSNFES